MLDRASILSKKDLKRVKVTVPEWGGDVYVSEMTGEARDEWDLALYQSRKSGTIKNSSARLVIATVVNEKGNRIFSDKDIGEVGKLSSGALDRITRASQKINNIGVKAIKDAEKNSEAAPSGGSTSS